MKITILGCGSSLGVPVAGIGWGNCDPAEPRNWRRRASILVEQGDTTLLIDTSPDMRMQLIDAGVHRIDAVLWTHAHADHLHGINDLRGLSLTGNRRIPGFADATTQAEIFQSFGYLVGGAQGYRPILEMQEITGRFRVGDIEIEPMDQDHGFSRSLGFRFGDFAYSTDVVTLPEQSLASLKGVGVWLVDSLRDEPHPTHAHLARTLEWSATLRPSRTVLTHMSHHTDYRTWEAKLPKGVEPAYDGLVLEI